VVVEPWPTPPPHQYVRKGVADRVEDGEADAERLADGGVDGWE
jgi:hypothetical protein